MSAKNLEGKVALVTGGSTGIGLATAKAFAEAGATVFLTGRRETELKAAAKAIGSKAHGIVADVSKVADLDRVNSQIKSTSGRLDVLFANAGVGTMVPIRDVTESHYAEIFDTNVKGVVFTVQRALPLLVDGASIILNGSTTSVTGTPNFTIYSASKAAVRNLARSWVLDLKDRHIRVNVVSPGPILTPGLVGVAGTDAAAKKGLLDYLTSQIPLGRIGRPEEVAKAVLFLASDDSSFVNGTELFVDGGMAQV